MPVCLLQRFLLVGIFRLQLATSWLFTQATRFDLLTKLQATVDYNAIMKQKVAGK